LLDGLSEKSGLIIPRQALCQKTTALHVHSFLKLQDVPGLTSTGCNVRNDRLRLKVRIHCGRLQSFDAFRRFHQYIDRCLPALRAFLTYAVEWDPISHEWINFVVATLRFTHQVRH